MATLNTIDSGNVKRLQEACAIRGVTILGVPGGWSLLIKYGMIEKPLGTQRTGKVRIWRSVDTLLTYLREELGICKVDGIDASGYNEASVFRARPDAAVRMRQAHAGLAETLMAMPNVGHDEDFERVGQSRLKELVLAPGVPVSIDAMSLARAGNKALKKMIDDGRH